MLSPQDIAASLLTAFSLLYIYISRRRRRALNPPGPKGFPVIGNLFDIPETKQWFTFARWSQEHKSPIIHLSVLGKHIYVINNIEVAQEIFERTYDNYNGRPRMAMLNEAVGFDWDFAFSPDLEKWKACRREFEPCFRKAVAQGFRSQEARASIQLLDRLLKTPDNWINHFRQLTGSLILDITYGINSQSQYEQYIHIAEKALEGLERSGDRNVFDIFPWVQHIPSWLPGMGWKKKVDEWKRLSHLTRDVPFEWVKQRMISGEAKPCIATDLLTKLEGKHGDEDWNEYIMKCVTSTAFVAGADTTVSSFNTLVLAMMLYPEVQRKAQEQIDQVMANTHRLPDFSDQAQLPYISAIIQEVLRWGVVVPIAIPHETTKDAVFRDYHIPKDSTVIGNTWAILRDPVAYPEPEKFSPERFLTPDGLMNTDVKNPNAAWGYGRHICPGRFMAMDSLWITTAHLLAAFSFSKPNGQHVPPPSDMFSGGVISHPLPYKCNIEPRSESVVELIRSSLLAQDS